MNLTFHHTGVATKSIEKDLHVYESLGYTVGNEEIFIDAQQGIKGLFINSLNGPRLELLENIEHSHTLDNFIKSRQKYYHIAYECSCIEQTLTDFIKETNAKIISPIKPAVYFEKVCFLMLPNLSIVELVQKRKSKDKNE